MGHWPLWSSALQMKNISEKEESEKKRKFIRNVYGLLSLMVRFSTPASWFDCNIRGLQSMPSLHKITVYLIHMDIIALSADCNHCRCVRGSYVSRRLLLVSDHGSYFRCIYKHVDYIPSHILCLMHVTLISNIRIVFKHSLQRHVAREHRVTVYKLLTPLRLQNQKLIFWASLISLLVVIFCVSTR